jgi:hypothetical protein
MLRETKINTRSRDTGNRFVKATYPPEMAMWASMLELAINDYVTGASSNYGNEHFRSAYRWIFSEDQNYINSFDSICILFNINPDKTRKALLADPAIIKARLSGKDKKKEE